MPAQAHAQDLPGEGCFGPAHVHRQSNRHVIRAHSSLCNTAQVCTLRNTPDKPIHCIVWAKEMLFPLLFGAPEASDLNETIGG